MNKDGYGSLGALPRSVSEELYLCQMIFVVHEVKRRHSKCWLLKAQEVPLLSGYDMPGKVSRHGIMADVRNHPL